MPTTSAHKHTTFARINDSVSAAVFDLVWFIGVIALSLVFAGYYVGTIQISDPRCGVLTILAGAGHRPYVYRVLSTLVLRAMMHMGLDAASSLSILVSITAIGSICAFRYLVSFFGGYRARAAVISPLIVAAVAVLTVSFPYNMVYDMPTLALVVAGYALMLRRHWRWYIVVFTLACLSKETAFILTVGFAAVYFRCMMWRDYIVLGGLQFAVWVAVRALVTWLYGGYPGVSMETHWDLHLFALHSLPVAVAIYCALATFLVSVILRRWHDKPIEMKRLFVSIAPLLVVLYFVGGNPFELRVFAEVTPIAAILFFAPTTAPVTS